MSKQTPGEPTPSRSIAEDLMLSMTQQGFLDEDGNPVAPPCMYSTRVKLLTKDSHR